MKPVKILLLVILLSLIPSSEAAFYINQTTNNGVFKFIGAGEMWINQSFTTPNYANFSQATIDYVELWGQSLDATPRNLTIHVTNNTFSSYSSNVSFTTTLQSWRVNFTTPIILEKNSQYYFNLTSDISAGIGFLVYYANTNPYSGGRAFDDSNSLGANDDLQFNISLSPHDNVGNWTFNQGANVYANDSSGNNLNASKTAGSMGWSTNLLNGSVNASSLNFDGSTYLTITNSTGLASDQLNFSYFTPYSIDVWVRTNNTPTTSSNVIVSKILSGTNGGYELNYSNGKIYWTIARNTDATSLVVNTSSVVISSAWTWYHILATYDGSSSTAGATIYVNGVSSPLQSLVNTVSGESRNGVFLKIGVQSGTTNFLNGTMDEMKIYNYALNSSYRSAVYSQYHPTPAYPVGNHSITGTGATQPITFLWYDDVASSDEINIATDSGFTNIIHSGIHATDTATVTLDSNTTYYWRVRQIAGGGGYGNTSETQKFTLGKFNGYLNIAVLDEMTFKLVPIFNATVYGTGFVKSKSSTTGVVNFTASDVEPGQFTLVITVNSTYAERAIIVNSPGNYTVFVPSTTAYTVDFVSFYLLDYTGRFPYANTNLTITKGVNITHSQYFDSDAKVATNLIRGERYTLTVYNPSTSDMQTWGDYSSSGTGSVQVVISAFGINESVLKPYAQSISRDGNDINFAWNDRNNVLNWLNITVYQDNYSYLVYSLNTSINAGTATFTITNTSALYFAQMNASTTRSDTIDSLIIDLRTGTELIRNLSYGSFSIPAWFKNALAIVLMFMLAGSFGAMHRGEGAIITGFIGVYLWYIGWLIMSTAIAVLFGSMVMFAILYHMNTKSKPGYF